MARKSPKKTETLTIKRTEVRKSIRKPAVRPSQEHEDKRKRPLRGRVGDTECE